MFFIKSMFSFVIALVLSLQCSYAMEEEKEMGISPSSKGNPTIARFVIKQGQMVQYIDNPEAPLLFKLIDKERNESYLLFTQHNKPLESFHSEILQIFNNQTSMFVTEPKPLKLKRMSQGFVSSLASQLQKRWRRYPL